MKKLLIATDSRLFAQSLQQSLSAQLDVMVCHDGQTAAELLYDFRPDLLAVDLMLSGIDGIGLIQMARSAGIRPQVIACSAYITEYITAALERLNTACLIRTPCDHRYVAARILDVASWQSAGSGVERELRNILTVLGFRPNHAGTLITEACVLRYMDAPNQKLSSQLYPAVGEAFGGTPVQVERAMGRAVEGAWKHGDEQTWRMYFPTGKNGKVTKPTNTEFLAVMAQCLTPPEELKSNRLTG